MLSQQTRAKATRGISLAPYTTLEKGEKGTVVHYEVDEMGLFSADILMDKSHKGLNRWNNVAHITGPELDDVQFSNRWAFLRVDLSYGVILAIGIIALLGGSALTEALEAQNVGSAIFERAVCGSYDCLGMGGGARRAPVEKKRGKEHGRNDTAEGVT